MTLLFDTTRIGDQYDFFRSCQLAAADATEPGLQRVEFVETLHEPVFGGQRFSIRDCNGYTLQFLQGALP